MPGASLKPATKVLSGPSHKLLPVKGQFEATLRSQDRGETESVFVVDDLSCALLGRPPIESLDLVCRVRAIHSKEDLLRYFPKLLNGLGKLEGDYKIQLQEDSRPYALSTPRRVAIPMLPKVKAELQRMEDMGVVRRVQEPTEWCAGMVPVPKPGGKVRICIDLTRLNERGVQRKPPTPGCRTSTGTASRSAAVYEIGHKLRVLADTLSRRIKAADNVYNAIWKVLLQLFAIWHSVSPRAFPATHVGDPTRRRRGCLPNG